MPAELSLHVLLEELLFIADKCTSIAIHFRSIDSFSDLIQEKFEDKNPRFMRDFKTFADVLIQQVTVYWLDLKFPGLSKSIFGEEDNQFRLPTDETIIIQIANSRKQLHHDLERIMSAGNNNNHNPENKDKIREFVNILIDLIYQPSSFTQTNLVKKARNILGNEESPILELSRIALWIDPIDSTSEYIRGNNPTDTLEKSGLHCVTCLFGVFDKLTGLPLMGVISQPFNSNSKTPTILWGYSYENKRFNNLSRTENVKQNELPIVVGKNETNEFKERLSRIASTFYISGAGYKLFLVIQDRCQALITSSKTTYYWDTCAGHAILLSLGGGIVSLESCLKKDYFNIDYDDLLEFDDLLHFQIRYKGKDCDEKKFNHGNGLVAYSSVDVFNKIYKSFRY